MNASDDPTVRLYPACMKESPADIARHGTQAAANKNPEKNSQRRKNNRIAALKGLALGVAVAMVTGVGIVATQAERFNAISQAYLYGYPLVMMDLTRENFTRTLAPVNTLLHARTLPSADFREVVRPNVDTLYSSAWLDLSEGPMVFSIPSMERFHVIQFMDAWTHVFASIGSRTLGEKGGDFLVVGPDWYGEVPEGVTVLRSPTRMVWMLGRIANHGEEDYPVVHALQDRLSLTPLEAWIAGARDSGIAYRTPSKRLPKPLDAMRALEPEAFFARLQSLMIDNPPHDLDERPLVQWAKVGFETGIPDGGTVHEPRSIDAWTRGLMTLAFKVTDQRMQAVLDEAHGLRQGWQMAPVHIGHYGDDYALRAVVAMVGLGANLAADAVYPNANVDVNGDRLEGGKSYQLHFAESQTPPVSGFWSVTVYDREGFLIPNSQGRHALGDRDTLVRDADGGITLHLQSSAPEGDALANWLPIPAEGSFSVTARMYWPNDAVLRATWQLPGIEPVIDPVRK